jgi:hypothetical protein
MAPAGNWASGEFSSQAAAGNRRSVAQPRAGKILNAGEDNETGQDVALSQTETSLKVIAANDVIIIPATANFFPTALSLRRSSGHSKTTLCPPYFANVPDTLKTVAFRPNVFLGFARKADASGSALERLGE